MLETTTGCPHALLRLSPRWRARMSFDPPAANGTTRVTGFVGNWAWAAVVKTMAAAARADLRYFMRFLRVELEIIWRGWRGPFPPPPVFFPHPPFIFLGPGGPPPGIKGAL